MGTKEKAELTLSMNHAFQRWINVSRMVYSHPRITARPEMKDHLPSLAVHDEKTISILYKVAVKRFNTLELSEADYILVDNIWGFVKTATALHIQLNEEMAGNRKTAPTYTEFQSFMKDAQRNKR